MQCGMQHSASFPPSFLQSDSLTCPGWDLIGEEEDGLDEIDPSNIVDGGRRTRGRVIDWAKAAEENPAEDDDEDDEDDFEPENEQEDDSKMDES